MEYLATGRVHIGDVREMAGRLEPQSVQTIVTSPPYFGLRDYGTATWEGGDGSACDHQGPPKRTQAGFNERYFGKEFDTDKQGGLREHYRGTCAKCGAARVDKQLGMEATPAEFVANLVAVFAALRDCLKDNGCLWLNLGDSFGPDKCLYGMPWRVAFALIDDGWILRSDCIWAKPAPMPESVTDRPTRAHEYLFLLTKRPTYFYDATAIAERTEQPIGIARLTGQHKADAGGFTTNGHGNSNLGTNQGAATRNKRSVWTIPSAQFPGSHFATFPPDLVRPCVLAGTSAAGECSACGKAWVRCVEKAFRPMTDRSAAKLAKGSGAKGLDASSRWDDTPRGYTDSTTTGWAPQCQCPPGTPTRPQTVLDPFAGSCTTWQVAHELGRAFVGIDLDERATKWGADRLAKMPVGTLPGLATAAD